MGTRTSNPLCIQHTKEMWAELPNPFIIHYLSHCYGSAFKHQYMIANRCWMEFWMLSGKRTASWGRYEFGPRANSGYRLLDRVYRYTCRTWRAEQTRSCFRADAELHAHVGMLETCENVSRDDSRLQNDSRTGYTSARFKLLKLPHEV